MMTVNHFEKYEAEVVIDFVFSCWRSFSVSEENPAISKLRGTC